MPINFSNYNEITIVGNLGREPELQVTNDGIPYTKFSVAYNKMAKNNGGERKKQTYWFNCTAWDKLAEHAERFLFKGSKVMVKGELTYRDYNDKQGNLRTAVEITVYTIVVLSEKSERLEDGDPFVPEF